MEKAIINTPLGITEIQGDENGISKIYIRDENDEITSKIPSELEEAAIQLQEYFEGKRTHFPFCYIHQELNFKKKYGKNYSISHLEKHALI